MVNHRYSLLACPRTGCGLTLCGSDLRSVDGSVRYEMRDGIPYLLENAPVEGPHERKRLERLLKLCCEVGWRQAVDRMYGLDSLSSRYVTDINRASFLELLPLNNSTIALEIGASLGQMTASIARCCEFVYALEVVHEQSVFTYERLTQEGVSNAMVVTGGDGCRLPYRSNSFDVVIMNLVLEWCFSRNEKDVPAAAQRKLLIETHRVLKNGGILYVATKNRYALRYLLGGRDEHVGNVRWGNALPRYLLRFLYECKLVKWSGLLHSYCGLERMLRTSGFQTEASYWATPEVRYPTHYVATDSQSIREARRSLSDMVQGAHRSTRLLMPWVPSSLVKYCTPGLAFIVRKPRYSCSAYIT